MIGQHNRFHGRSSLKRHYTQSKSVRSGMLSLRYMPAKQPAYRLAVVVSRKVHKSAVVRNRIRRRIYENVRILSSDLSAPYDLVILVYDAGVAVLPPSQLTAELKKLCQKAGLTAVKPVQHAIVESKE